MKTGEDYMPTLTGHWKEGPLIIFYEIYGDKIKINSYLYQVKIGYTKLTPAHPAARKTANVDKAKIDLNINAKFVEKTLECKGEIYTYNLSQKKWKCDTIHKKLENW